MGESLPRRPAILYAVPPREGHMRPALQICAHLISQQFDVTILGTPRWKTAIESIGCHFSPVIGLWNTLDDYTRWPTIAFAAGPTERLAASLSEGFTTLLPSGYHSVWFALAGMRSRLGKTGRIVVLSDTCLSGTMPLTLGADLPPGFDAEERIRVLGISVVPAHWVSPERPPWGSGLSFDDSEAGQARNCAAHTAVWDQEAEDRGRALLNMMGCSRSLDSVWEKKKLLDQHRHDRIKHPFWDAVSMVNDTTLQMGLSSLEFPSPDWPSHFKFAGALPPKPLPADTKYPAWWDEIIQNSGQAGGGDTCACGTRRKNIITVAQGTEVLDYNQLIMPSIRCLADRDDILVVVLLGVRGANLDPYLDSLPDGTLPANTRVLDYFPYDAVLAHSDVFVSNSGYGGLTHAVTNGVPMVQTGKDFDKPDIGRRIEYAGFGIFLPNPPPSSEDLRAAIHQILDNDKYRRRAQALKMEAEAVNPLETIENEVLKLAKLA